MRINKNFVDYKKFLQEFKQDSKDVVKFHYFDGVLGSYRTPSKTCKYIYNKEILTPNKFCDLLGIKNYMGFVNSKFSKLKDFEKTEKDVLKWYNGYFGGLVGINRDNINKYVGSGEIFDIYDYDINKAYLYELTNFLPTKFKQKISYTEFKNKKPFEMEPYFLFFEIKVSKVGSQFMSCYGKIRSVYYMLDFLNCGKKCDNIIVSEKRLRLIQQIYLDKIEILNVYLFEKHKYCLYERILFEYLKIKDNMPDTFKQNALRLYGTLGQIKKYTPCGFSFAKNGDLLVNYNFEYNLKASPQVAMWVADSVAEKLFDIISANLDNVICWNTDGITSIKPLNLQLSKKPGKWKLNKFTGVAFLFNECGSRLFFKDIHNGQFVGAKNLIEKNGKIYECIEFKKTNINKGLVIYNKKIEIDKYMQFNKKNTFRNLIMREKFIKEISRDYEFDF